MFSKHHNPQHNLDELVKVLQSAASDHKLMKEFLADLLTPQELEEIPLRWQIVKRLAKGVPQQEIAQNLGMGVATVTRGSRELRDEHGGFRLMLHKLKIS